MRQLFALGALICGLALTACETVPKTDPVDPPADASPPSQPNADDSGVTVSPPPSPPVATPNPDTGGVITAPNSEPFGEPGSGSTSASNDTISISAAFQSVPGWGNVDFKNALISFQRGCAVLAQKDPESNMHSRAVFGKVGDWITSCNMAQATPAWDNITARRFFESEFLPVDLSGAATPEGMVTAYYQPEIQARRIKDAVFSEPILRAPSNAADLTLARSQITENVSTVIAYGRPIDVFFMQIQGSGVLVFEDGSRIRAAYDANNGRPYTSIGRVLIDRGVFTKDQASKQRIEAWMVSAGPVAARALMNENARYIFFKEEAILPDEGPKGAMRVPLTDMASIAVDPAHYPYGIPVWLEVKIPIAPGDYKGSERQVLVMTQDTGKAIRGPYRADLYFGSGDYAGELAGVMKHTGRWTVLLPFHLAAKFLPRS